MRKTLQAIALTAILLTGFALAPALYAHGTDSPRGGMMGPGMMGQGGMMQGDQGGMMGMMNMMGQMNQMMTNCNKMMQSMMPQKQRRKEPDQKPEDEG